MSPDEYYELKRQEKAEVFDLLSFVSENYSVYSNINSGSVLVGKGCQSGYVRYRIAGSGSGSKLLSTNIYCVSSVLNSLDADVSSLCRREKFKKCHSISFML